MNHVRQKPRHETNTPRPVLQLPFEGGLGPSLLIGLATILLGMGVAWHYRWVCDDAFISYRYAQNLVEGKGLVFNEGERVEGYSNFTWTLWCAVALLVGAQPEAWTIGWGIACYAAALALLVYHHVQLRRFLGVAGLSVPLAAILGVAHTDWSIYATSGLETSLFTVLLVAAYVQLIRGIADGRMRPLSTAILVAMAALTRPDGALFGPITAGLFLWLAWPKKRAAIVFASVFGALYGAFLLWRHAYYGDWLPNTYYAKSAHLAWWQQGLKYAWLYLLKYGLVAVGFLLFPACLMRRRSGEAEHPPHAIARTAVVLAAFTLPFTLYVIRLGGDFMFARMLIPVTPFYLILLDLGLLLIPLRRAAGRLALAAICCLALWLPPTPMSGPMIMHGVANEWSYYQQMSLKDGGIDAASAHLKRFFDGLPVRIAFLGSEAHLMHRARIPVAIEAEAGLTDRFIARQRLDSRGRVGHEKNAPPEYLITERKVHFAISQEAPRILRLPEVIPNVQMHLGGWTVHVLHWDPVIMEELRRRGAEFADFPEQLDEFIGRMAGMPIEQVEAVYRKVKRFYFDSVPDPKREAPFLKRLGRATAG